jgi:hypothetical protein
LRTFVIFFLCNMSRLALASVLATAEAGTLAVTWKDCGAKHGKVTDLKPLSIETGSTVTVTGTGTVDEEVTAGHFTATVSALGTKITECSGDGTKDIVCSLPMGVGSVTLKALPFPLAKGTVTIPVEITTSPKIPASLANVDVHVAATEQNGEDAICLDVHAAAKVDYAKGFVRQPRNEAVPVGTITPEMRAAAPAKLDWTETAGAVSPVKDQIEHIGFMCAPDNVNIAVTPAAGWKKLQLVLERIRKFPGFRSTRKLAVSCYARPLWNWGCPIFSLAPSAMVHCCFKAILGTRCRWWCRGRFWCLNIDVNPHYNAILTSVQRLSWELEWSGFLHVNYTRMFAAISLEFVRYEPERGCLFRRLRNESDKRVLEAFGRRRALWTSEEKVPHILRLVMRARALSMTYHTRNDSEAINDVDIEASSQPAWRKFKDELSKEKQNYLEIFQCGAVSTPTRRMVSNGVCNLCHRHIYPSMRHFVVECPYFKQHRDALNHTFNITPSWWLSIPRVTSKSGWICYSAHPQRRRRSQLQVAVCSMGLRVMEQTQLELDGRKGPQHRQGQGPPVWIR